MSLEVGVLARVEVEELGVGEESKVGINVEVLLCVVLRANGVELAQVLGHVGSVTPVVGRHFCESGNSSPRGIRFCDVGVELVSDDESIRN